jgi:putative NADPH-quinone reductase
MRVLVVYAHPVPDSFNAALHMRLLQALDRAGHEVRDLDLYGMGFAPAMSEAERRDYMTRGANTAAVAEHLEHLRWAEALILVYPTWWYSLPAMLKGWLDRVFVPYETFELGTGLNPILGRLTNIRLIGGITTYGSPRWWIRLVVRDPGKTIVMKGLKPLCAKGCRTFWLGLYRMDTVSEVRRKAFLDRVEALAARL